MLRIPFEQLHRRLTSALVKLGFAQVRAAHCARLFAETTRDGVYTHGVARFPRFVATVRNGSVNPAAEPKRVSGFGAIERWDGCLGPGNLNAYSSMSRAIELAAQFGISCVSLGHTNHWMRGGTYGWQAAEAGMIGICWTNTMPNLPPWGSSEAAIGNNPLVIAVPRKDGPVVLDMAMSQFSYGALESYRKRGEMLPVDGGFDSEGELTRDPAEIEKTQRPLPMGYWKGAGLSVVLDMVAAMLSLGNATHAISTDPLRESGLSQVFIAIHPDAFVPSEEQARIADEIVASIHTGKPAEAGTPLRYPGEKTLRLREENLRLGIPVDEEIWEQINAL